MTDRPRLPQRLDRHVLIGLVPAVAGVAVVAGGLLSRQEATTLLRQVAPVLAFLVFVTALAGLADGAGVFEAAAVQAARLGRGRTPVLFGLVVLLSCASTVLLSLDTTAVLVTPVVLATTRRLELPTLPFALVTVWLANTASLLLPVSNLTNLLAATRLDVTVGEYVGLVGPAALCAVATTVVVAVAADHRRLAGRYDVPDRQPVPDRALFRTALVVLSVLALLLVLGAPPAPVTGALALALGVVTAVRRPSVLRWDLVPWRLVPLVVGLLLVAEGAGRHGLDALLHEALGDDPGPLRLAAAAALSGNALNNLPAFLALSRVVPREGLPGLLLGADVGPLVLPWASLATLLWADRCRAAGVVVPWRSFVLRGLVLVPLLLVLCAGFL